MTDDIDTAQERGKLAALAGFTPGPWDAHGLTVYDTCMDGVASCHANADARLIAAAPDLLASNHRLLDALDAMQARAEKAEAERGLGRARLAAVRRDMRERCAQAMLDFDYDEAGPQLAGVILDLPLDPDAEAALQRVVDAAWNEALHEAEVAAEEVVTIWEAVMAIRALKRPEASHE